MTDFLAVEQVANWLEQRGLLGPRRFENINLTGRVIYKAPEPPRDGFHGLAGSGGRLGLEGTRHAALA